MAKKEIDSKIAEEKLLSCLLYKPDKIVEVIDTINPSIFSTKEYSQIYKCIVELYKEDIIPDEAMIIHKSLTLGYDIQPELVKKLCNGTTFVTKRQMKQYCDVIKSASFKRKTIDVCSDFLEKAKNITSPEKIVNDFFGLAIELSDKIKAENHTSAIDIDKKELLSSLDTRYKNPNMLTGLSTGFPTFDKYIDGICNGKIYSLCGHNGHGKSYLSQQMMINMAVNLTKGKINKKILFFSLEMTRKQMEERCLSIISGIDSKYFKNPKLYFLEKKIPDTEENFNKFKQAIVQAVEFLNKLPIIIDDASTLSVYELVSIVKKYILKEGVACVFVDYAGLIINDDCEEYQNICKTYQVLKQTAKDMQIPFVILNQYLKSFQQNPKNANRGTLFDIYGGKSVLNDSHVVSHILYPQKCAEYLTEHPECAGKLVLYCDKNRDAIYGDMPDIWLAFDKGQLKETKQIQQQTQTMINQVFGKEENNAK